MSEIELIEIANRITNVIWWVGGFNAANPNGELRREHLKALCEAQRIVSDRAAEEGKKGRSPK